MSPEYPRPNRNSFFPDLPDEEPQNAGRLWNDAGELRQANPAIGIYQPDSARSGAFDPNPNGGTAYYVDGDTGSDSDDGSEASPWATISHAVSQVSAGDTVNIAPGTYTEAIDTDDLGAADGSADSRIMFQRDGQSGDVMLTNDGARALMHKSAYWTWRNIHIAGESPPGNQCCRVQFTNNVRFENVVWHSNLQVYETTDVEIYHCAITGRENMGIDIRDNSSVTMRNSIVTGASQVWSGYRGINVRSGCTLDMDYCHVFGNSLQVDSNIVVSGTLIDGGHNQVAEDVGTHPPGIRSHRRGKAIINWSMDDSSWDYFEDMAFAAEQVGARVTVFANRPDTIADARMQRLHDRGHEIAAHGYHGTPRFGGSYTDAITVGYTGSESTCTMTINSDATQLTLDSANDAEDHTIDLTASANDTLTDLVSTIDGYSSYSCSLAGDGDGDYNSNVLETISSQDITSVYTVNYDTLRLFQDEMTRCKTYLESHITGLTVDTMAWPGGQNNATYRGHAQDEGFLGARAVTDEVLTKTLSEVQVFATYGVVAHYPVDNDEDEEEARRKARHLAAAAKAGGLFLSVYSHTASDCTAQRAMWMIDEWVKDPNIKFCTYGEAIDEIRTTHTDADGDGTRWTMDLGDNFDARLHDDSPCVDAGTPVSGVAQDYDGNVRPS